MKEKILNFLDKYKTYLILIALCFLIFISFNPIKNKVSDYLLTKNEIKDIKNENKNLKKINKEQIDTAIYYKNLFDKEKQKSDSSKELTKQIKTKTNEEVKTIPNIPADSNIRQFPRDMEEFLKSRE